jgi:predicted PP-loop superfamily ATPase
LTRISGLYTYEDGSIEGRTVGCGCCSQYIELTLEEAIEVCNININYWKERLEEYLDKQRKK